MLEQAARPILDRMTRPRRRWLALLLAVGCPVALAALDPDDRADRWWDASRADRIGFSDRAAARCKSRSCDSLQIRSCINDALKPPVAAAVRGKTLAEVTTGCIAAFNAKP